ncbi:MarR family winged helix-turn-helix transcriptional regulator [Streptomyces sp. NPDC051105]|uniref:MarR family winged helix-turn-helix transcriptional regulator n=1 Tax=Streptomyces sp. NPDC051105 TaxID=3154843 RepID=UPI003444F74C
MLRDRTPGVRELARHLGLDKSGTTGLVGRAERRDLVRRSPSPHDKRSLLVSITPEGQNPARRCATEAEQQIRDLTTHLTAHLTDEQRSRLSLLASALVSHHTPI